MGHRYIGSKTRVLEYISEEISRIVGRQKCIADIMCGTASVSQHLREIGHAVHANDVMTYSFHHARVALLLPGTPEFKGAKAFINKHWNGERLRITRYEKMLEALSKMPPRKGYFWREFSIEGTPQNTPKARNYFSPDNAMIIDAIRYWVRKLARDGSITSLEHSLLLHDLIMGANDIANIAGTYGHHMAKLCGRANEKIMLKPSHIRNNNDRGKHTVTRGYAEEVAKNIECDLCYIDPPYMKRQYAANYHVLETLAREDEPAAIGVSGLRPWRDQYSNFCTKTKIRQSFKDIVTRMKCRNFLISYSEDGLLSINEISELLRPYGRVKVKTFENKRFRSNSSNLGTSLTEYLIHLKVV